MIHVPDPSVDLVDDPGDPAPEEYDGPLPDDLCPGCGGPEPYMKEGCCDWSFHHWSDPWWVEQLTREMEDISYDRWNEV